jgi:hypothetical protein
VGTAELSALGVGFGYGAVLARGADRRSPSPRLVAAATVAVAIVAAVCARQLRHIADVAPEIARVIATEERTASAYQAVFGAFKQGRVTADAVAQLAERTIVPELQAADARLSALRNVPAEHQSLVSGAREYLQLRAKSWRVRADAIRRTSLDPRRGSNAPTDAAWRLQAETRHRSNQMAMGNAEGAERASLESFQRLKTATEARLR